MSKTKKVMPGYPDRLLTLKLDNKEIKYKRVVMNNIKYQKKKSILYVSRQDLKYMLLLLRTKQDCLVRIGHYKLPCFIENIETDQVIHRDSLNKITVIFASVIRGE